MRRGLFVTALLFFVGLGFAQQPAGPPPDKEWFANATLKDYLQVTDEELGAGQGVTLLDGKLYFYGDAHNAQPRCGIIKEYTTDLKPTGRKVWLKKNGQPLLLHPTGLARHPKLGVFLGDTVNKKAKIYLLDWEKAWADGHLDNAVKTEIDDDAAHDGCRPCMVRVKDQWLLATADHARPHPEEPEIRFYDAEKLVAAKKSSAAGVIVHRIHGDHFMQNLHWDDQTGKLTLVMNYIRGRGWRLDEIDLAKALEAGRSEAQGVIQKRLIFAPHDELEGYLVLPNGQAIFVTASQRNNLTMGAIATQPPRLSVSGTLRP